MVKVEQNSILITSTGTEIPVLDDSTLVVSRVVVWVASSSTESSAGYYDSSVTFTGSDAYNEENASHVITHYRNISGTKTKVFEATVTSLSTGEFTLSVTTCTQNTLLNYVAYGS